MSAALLDALTRSPGSPIADVVPGDDPLRGDDSHLALYCARELHYDGWEGVDDGWEWDARVQRLVRRLEHRFLAAVDVAVAPRLAAVGRSGGIADRLQRLIDLEDGPSLSQYLSDEGTSEQLLEFAVHRSAYQLKEADPHTWAIPRLRGRSRAAIIEIQADEYGNGVPGEAHAELFARALDTMGLSSEANAYVDRLPGITLATTNLITALAMRRSRRGALVGHLAGFEMTSVVPMGRYAAVMRERWGEDAARFYDVHVEADAHHEVVAAHSLAGGLVEDEPHLADDVLWGAAALLQVEGCFARHLLERWDAGETSLRYPLDAERADPLDTEVAS